MTQKLASYFSGPLICGFLALILTGQSALAFERLTEAQEWIYDRGHLANTQMGQTLNYLLVGENTGADLPPVIEDKASLAVLATFDDGRRDVELEFLSGDRHIALPTFSGYRGNPIIIAMLEHIAQSMSTKSGGGALYFRNRIRDALASPDVQLLEHKASYQDEEYTATRLILHPFAGDQHLEEDDVLRQAVISIELSDGVPGGVISVAVSARQDNQVFERSLSLM